MKTQSVRTPRFIALFALGCLALSPMLKAVNPPPDGGYPGGNTAEGQSALLSLTTGTYNTAVGLYSLLSLTDGNFNTAIGAATLLVNTGDENTATGARELSCKTPPGLETPPMERSLSLTTLAVLPILPLVTGPSLPIRSVSVTRPSGHSPSSATAPTPKPEVTATQPLELKLFLAILL